MYELYLKVLAHFDYDINKAESWFFTPNPLLGNISPDTMIRIGKVKKLEKFINICLEENQL